MLVLCLLTTWEKDKMCKYDNLCAFHYTNWSLNNSPLCQVPAYLLWLNFCYARQIPHSYNCADINYASTCCLRDISNELLYDIRLKNWYRSEHSNILLLLKVGHINVWNLILPPPQFLYQLKDFLQTWLKCSPQQGDVQNPCCPCVSSRSRSQFKVKYQTIKY
jgi:hypothetical protein